MGSLYGSQMRLYGGIWRPCHANNMEVSNTIQAVEVVTATFRSYLLLSFQFIVILWRPQDTDYSVVCPLNRIVRIAIAPTTMVAAIGMMIVWIVELEQSCLLVRRILIQRMASLSQTVRSRDKERRRQEESNP
jgi:hypothetical protein